MNVKSTRRNQQGKGKPTKMPKNPSNSSGYKPIKKTLADYMYYLGSAKQSADYDNTTEYLINYINKTFIFGHDIASSLESLNEYDVEKHKPSLRASTSEDEMVAEIENKQFITEMRYDFFYFLFFLSRTSSILRCISCPANCPIILLPALTATASYWWSVGPSILSLGLIQSTPSDLP